MIYTSGIWTVNGGNGNPLKELSFWASALCQCECIKIWGYIEPLSFFSCTLFMCWDLTALGFLTQYNLDSLGYIYFQLDHNAPHTCNHNVLQHLTSKWHVLHKFFHTGKPLICNFIVSGNGILGKLYQNFGCQSSAIHWYWWSIVSHRLAAPLTEEQKYEVEVERQVLKRWSDYKRREYRANQELVRALHKGLTDNIINHCPPL